MLLCVALVMNGVLCADDEHPNERRVEKRLELNEWVESDAAAGKYWVGVQAASVNEALKSHLDLDYGVIVRRVIEGSPAAEAGLQEHDIF
jgi:C-terminal processing protease CtpA/Prc